MERPPQSTPAPVDSSKDEYKEYPTDLFDSQEQYERFAQSEGKRQAKLLEHIRVTGQANDAVWQKHYEQQGKSPAEIRELLENLNKKRGKPLWEKANKDRMSEVENIIENKKLAPEEADRLRARVKWVMDPANQSKIQTVMEKMTLKPGAEFKSAPQAPPPPKRKKPPT